MKKVSIIVPVYNVEKYLERCVQSIIKQSYSHIQIILVDDGSPDNCPEICETYASIDSRIKVIHKKNGGLGYARNTGLDNADGDYVMFVDSDDYIPSNYVEVLVKSIEQFESDVCVSGYNKIKSDGKVNYSVKYNHQIYEGNVKEKFLTRLFGSLPNSSDSIHPTVCGILYKIECINSKNVRFKSEREIVSEDLVFEIELFSNVEKVVIINDAMYNYCDNENTLSQSFSMRKLEGQEQLFRFVSEKIFMLGLPKEAIIRFQKLFMIYMKENIRLVSNMRMSKKEKNNLIKEIVRCQTVRQIVNEYPIRKMAFTPKIFMLCMKYKMYKLLSFFVRAR